MRVLFGKENKKTNPNTTDTLIGEKSVVEGNITSKASLRIEGKVKGDIKCEGDVIIGKNAELTSNILARNVINAGSITGSIKTDAMLTITSTGKVKGDIHVRSLSIAEGGVFIGSSKMDVTDRAQDSTSHEQKMMRNVEKLKKADAGQESREPGKAASSH